MSIKKIEVRFQIIKNNNPKNIVVYDYSEWAHIENKPAIIEITVPGFSEPVTHYLDKNDINYFNSIKLGLNCPECLQEEEYELPDGIYKLTVKGSPDKFNDTITYLKTDQIRLELDMILMKIDFCNKDVDSELIKRIQKIDLYLKAAEAHVRYDNVCVAQDLFFRAQDDIKKLQNCKTCV